MNLQTIQQLRDRKYSAPPLKIENQLFEKEEYIAYLASYISDGLKIYGFLTIPKPLVIASKAKQSFTNVSYEVSDMKSEISLRQLADRNDSTRHPLVVFCRGYLEKKDYATDRQYVRYIDFLAKKGFIVFKSDYRGYGDSDGREETIFEAGNAIDVLNAIEALKEFKAQSEEFRINDIYILGHSMGGDVALKVLEVNLNVKAASIWAAPTASYSELVKRWQQREDRKALASKVIEELGDPNENVDIYKKYSPAANLSYINAPIQLIHGREDDRVPVSDSEKLNTALKNLNKKVSLEILPGDHNLTDNLDQAMDKTIRFFTNETSF